MGFCAALLVVTLILILQGYVLYAVRVEGQTSLPENFGNTERVRRMLEEDGKKDGAFSFGVVADVQDLVGQATFESIIMKLREKPLKFLFIVGDATMFGCEAQHRYWRWKWKTRFKTPFPVFYLPGNHDVDPKEFPIDKFEKVYGPTNFCFEYRGCLFVGLRVLPKPFYDNTDARKYLAWLTKRGRKQYRKVFVFMHVPPIHTDQWHARSVNGERAMMDAIMAFHPDYVFSGDHHAYRRTEVNGVHFIVTGGGGGSLKTKDYGRFHHAMVLRVGPNSVAEDIMMISKRTSPFHMAGRFLFVKVYPRMRRHPVLTILLDVALLAWAVWLLWRRWAFRPEPPRPEPEPEPSAEPDPLRALTKDRPTLARFGG